LKDFKGKVLFGHISDVAMNFLYTINEIDNHTGKLLDLLDILPERTKELQKTYGRFCSNQVQLQTPYEFYQVKKELKENIVLKNYWSIFYLNYTLSERYTDYLISLNSKLLTDNFEEIKNTLEGKNKQYKMDFDYKIGKLTHIGNQHKSTYIHKLISLLTLFQKIRNTFMFHFKDVDLYSFVYSDNEIQQKEEVLIQELEDIKSEIEKTMKEFNDNKEIDFILKRSEQRISGIIGFLKQNQSGGKSFLITDAIYSNLIRVISFISYSFIFFVKMYSPDINGK
jgi:hypothetical protein